MNAKQEEIMKKRGYDQWFLLRGFDCFVQSLSDWIRFNGEWVSEEAFELYKKRGYIMPLDVAQYKSEKIRREVLECECPRRARFKAGDLVKVVKEDGSVDVEPYKIYWIYYDGESDKFLYSVATPGQSFRLPEDMLIAVGDEETEKV